MLNFSLKNYSPRLIWLGTRAVTVLFVIFLVSTLFIDYARIDRKAKAKFLNDYMPSVGYLLEFQDQKEPFNRKKFNDLVFYYNKVVSYIPERPDIYGILGFCYYHLGDTKKALSNYQKALVIFPQNFWFHYNVGIIHYNDKDYTKAIKSFDAAMKSNPDLALKFVSVSKAYWRILYNVSNVKQLVMGHLRDGYQDIHKLLILSHYELKDYRQVLKIAKKAISENLDDKQFFYHYVGMAAYHMKNYSLAFNAFKESIEINAQNPEGLRYLGLTLQALGKQEKVQEMFTRAKNSMVSLESDPLKKEFHLKIF